MVFLVILPEHTGCPFQQGPFPSLNLAWVDLEPGGQWATVNSTFTAFKASLALNDGLSFPRSFDMSHSSSQPQPRLF